MHGDGSNDVENWMDEMFRKRCSRAVQKNHAIRQQSAYLLDVARTLQILYALQSRQYLQRFGPSLPE